MGLIEIEDQKRYFVALAVKASQQITHPVSQFLQQEGVARILDNLYAVLSYCSSKQIESAEKGQHLLRKLLPFRSAEGFFCEYIHSYPNSAPLSYQIEALIILYELFTYHNTSVGSDLSKQCRQIFYDLKNKIILDQFTQSERLNFKYAVLDALANSKEVVDTSYNPQLKSRHLGEYLFYLRFFNSYFDTLLVFSKFWHPVLQIYTGPCLDEYYDKNYPELSLFDCYMASFYKSFHERFHGNPALALKGGAIKFINTPPKVAYGSFQGDYKSQKYTSIQNEKMHLFYFEDYMRSQEESKGFHLLRWAFIEGDSLFHFVCHSKVQKMQARYFCDHLEVDFTYLEEFPDDMEGQKELEFFINKDPRLSCTIDGEKATLFHLSNHLEIKTQSVCLRCHFTIIDGEGELNGHLSFGNRPSQLNRGFEPFDHRICLRTLRRSSHFVIRMHADLIYFND